MPASLSPEGKIATGLRELNCSARNFVSLSRELGAKTSDAEFSRAMRNSTKAFDHELGTKLTEILDRMGELQSAVNVPINWAASEKIATVLAIRLLAEVSAEMKLAGTEQLTYAAEQIQNDTWPPQLQELVS